MFVVTHFFLLRTWIIRIRVSVNYQSTCTRLHSLRHISTELFGLDLQRVILLCISILGPGDRKLLQICSYCRTEYELKRVCPYICHLTLWTKYSFFLDLRVDGTMLFDGSTVLPLSSGLRPRTLSEKDEFRSQKRSCLSILVGMALLSSRRKGPMSILLICKTVVDLAHSLLGLLVLQVEGKILEAKKARKFTGL